MIFYYSNKCKHCSIVLQELEKMPEVRGRFEYRNVDISKPEHSIKYVPAIVEANGMLVGKQVFEWIKNEQMQNTLPAFEVGFGTNNFSLISGEAVAQKNHNFTYIEETDKMAQIPQGSKENSVKGGKIEDGAMDRLMAQRNQEIPPPKSRN